MFIGRRHAHLGGYESSSATTPPPPFRSQGTNVSNPPYVDQISIDILAKSTPTNEIYDLQSFSFVGVLLVKIFILIYFKMRTKQGRRQRGVRGGHGRPRFGANTHTHTCTRIARSLCICVCTCTPAFFQGLIFGLRVESRLEHSHVLFLTPDVSRFFQRTRGRSTSLPSVRLFTSAR